MSMNNDDDKQKFSDQNLLPTSKQFQVPPPPTLPPMGLIPNGDLVVRATAVLRKQLKIHLLIQSFVHMTGNGKYRYVFMTLIWFEINID